MAPQDPGVEPGGAARTGAPRRADPPRRRWLAGLLALLVAAAAAALIARQAYLAPRGSGLVHALPELLQELPKDEQRVGRIILDSFQEYRANARNWSAAYFGSLFLSALCAALAGLVIKLEFLTSEGLKKDLAAALAMVSALLVTLSTVGGFHQRWTVNRLAAARMEKLGYVFMAPDRRGGLAAILAEIQAISYERNAEIVSGGGEPGRAGGRE